MDAKKPAQQQPAKPKKVLDDIRKLPDYMQKNNLVVTGSRVSEVGCKLIVELYVRKSGRL